MSLSIRPALCVVSRPDPFTPQPAPSMTLSHHPLAQDTVCFGATQRTSRARTNAPGGAFWPRRHEPQVQNPADRDRLPAELGWSPELTEQLFANGIRSPIIQGTIGDCYLLAGLRALLSHPKAIDLLKRIPIETVQTLDGEAYRVTLPGQKPVVVPVRDIDSHEFIAREGGGTPRQFETARGPGWIRLMEYVIGEHMRSQRLEHPYFNDAKSHPNARLMYLIEGTADEPLALLTGGQQAWLDSTGRGLTHTPDPFLTLISGDSIQPGRIDQHDTLKKSFADTGYEADAYRFLDQLSDEPDRWVMCANTPTSKTGMAFSEKLQVGSHKLERNHAYSILSVNKDKRTVDICDPKNDNVVMIMTYEQFGQGFQAFSGVKLLA